MYKFDIQQNSRSIIKVIGVGGGGSNAVNHMYNLGIKDVEFVVCNTDSQALKASPVPTKLQIGVALTQGLGAGGNPEKGRNAALESKEEIREFLSNNTKMVFITAGMGGGTGTGAAPVIAKMAKDMGILTVAIVTVPFGFEGKKKIALAHEGLDELRGNCDTTLVIMNDKIRELHKNLSLRSAYAQADMVLTNAAKSIAEIITVTYDSNVDFEDVRAVMENSGTAVMGTGISSGEERAIKATTEAINSPLLNNNSINGASKILVSIAYGEEAELSMDEMDEINTFITDQCQDLHDDLKLAHVCDPTLGDSLKVTVIATGFAKDHANSNPFGIPQAQQVAQPVAVAQPVQTAVAHTAQDAQQAQKNLIDLESNRVKQISLFDQFDTFNKPAAQPVAETPIEANPAPAETNTNPIPPIVTNTVIAEEKPIIAPESIVAPTITPTAETLTPTQQYIIEQQQLAQAILPTATEVIKEVIPPAYVAPVQTTPIFEAPTQQPVQAQPEPVAPKANTYSWDINVPNSEPRLENNNTQTIAEQPAQPVVNRIERPAPQIENWNEEAERKRQMLLEEAQRRIDRLKGLSENNITDDYKERFEVPAYQREHKTLTDIPHSSERNISRLTLNDDNEILGNNKFLHDNVD